MNRFAQDAGHLLLRGPARTGIAPSIPDDLRDIAVPQHDLSVYDAMGRLA